MKDWEGKTVYNPVTRKYYAVTEENRIIDSVENILQKAFNSGMEHMLELYKQPITWGDFKEFGLKPLAEKIKKLLKN